MRSQARRPTSAERVGGRLVTVFEILVVAGIAAILWHVSISAARRREQDEAARREREVGS